MSKSGPEKLKMKSPDMILENIEEISYLFPNVITEIRGEDGNIQKGIDVDRLKQEFSDNVIEGRDERFEFTWVGKKKSMIGANLPIQKTLRPCIEESKNWEKTKNIFIEGDNLDALKLLQESYLNQVKLIYIDPPYNIGDDKIYKDKFFMDADEYDEELGAVDEYGNRLIKNTKDRGRYHSDWCSMIFSRLILARNLLQEEGFIVVSIDDIEMSNTTAILNEIFGEDNKIAVLVWDKNRKNDAAFFSVGHEYMLVYAKNKAYLTENKIILRAKKEGLDDVRIEFDRLREKHGSNWEKIQKGLKEFFKSMPDEDPRKALARFNKVDEKGPYRDDGNPNWPGGGGPRYEVPHPITKKPCKIPRSGWRWPNKERFDEEYKAGNIIFGPDETTIPSVRSNLFEKTTAVMGSVQYAPTPKSDQDFGSVQYSYAQKAAQDFDKIFDGVRIFDNPKPYQDLARIIEYLTNAEDIVVDFFAGACSTAHGVFEVNYSKNTSRRFICIQLPEPVDEKTFTGKNALKMGFKTISAIGMERIRRSGEQIKKQTKTQKSQVKISEEQKITSDIGFRVFKIDDSNMKDVYYAAAEYSQETIEGLIDNVKLDRTDLDLLYQIIVDWGLPLDLPHDIIEIDGFHIHIVDSNALIACFDANISESVMRKIAAKKPLRAVFRDGSFKSSPGKLNIEGLFKTIAPDTTLRVI